MKAAVCMVVLALVGCATPVPAEKVSDMELCKYTLYGNSNDQVVAGNEAKRRGLDCAPLYPAIVAREQQRTNALNQASQQFNRPPPPQPVNCTSYRVGNSVETTCK